MSLGCIVLGLGSIFPFQDRDTGLLLSSVSITMNPGICRDGAQAPDANDQPGIVTGNGSEDVAGSEHVGVGVEELLVAGVLLPHAVGEIGQGALGIVVASMAPSGQMADAKRNAEQTVASAIRDVGMAESLRYIAQKPPVGL